MMLGRVAIVGVGYVPLRSVTPEVSYRELILEAAVKAYNDAGVEPRDISTSVSVTEDYTEGTAIADEYVPDQLGAVLKPVHTVTSDGITGLASLVMQLKTGQMDLAVDVLRALLRRNLRGLGFACRSGLSAQLHCGA